MVEDVENKTGGEHHLQMFKCEFHELIVPLMVILWVLIGVVSKLVFNMSRRISHIFPDSSLLLVLGLLVGCILHFSTTPASDAQYVMSSEVFFHYLLPPIVLDAGYFMPNRLLFLNIGTVLTFAVLGTVFNMLTIGLSLWGLGYVIEYIPQQEPIDLVRILLFTSLISAVDPVAVLAVFEEIGINKTLYISVFGESLFNDAVTMVLYHMMQEYYEIQRVNSLNVADMVLAPISFLYVSLGGILVGIILAFVASFATRFTGRIRLLEPLLVLSLAYAAYLIAEGFRLSSILAIVAYGQFCRQFVSLNLDTKSKTTLNYFIKTLSTCSETIIFIYLGLSAMKHNHVWSAAFIGLTLLFCLLYRTIGVLIQCFFLNKMRLPDSRFSFPEQFIMAYGGLRGAIAYGLAQSIHTAGFNDSQQDVKDMFLTTTIVVVIFTVFVQGTTIKPLVGLLKVKKEEERHVGIAEKTFEMLQEKTMGLVETVIGHSGHMRMMLLLDKFNEKVLWKVLLSENARRIQSRTHAMLQKAVTNEKILMNNMIQGTNGQLNGQMSTVSTTTNDLRMLDKRDQHHTDFGLKWRNAVQQVLRNSVIAGGETNLGFEDTQDLRDEEGNRRARQNRLQSLIDTKRRHSHNLLPARTRYYSQPDRVQDDDQVFDDIELDNGFHNNGSIISDIVVHGNPAFDCDTEDLKL